MSASVIRRSPFLQLLPPLAIGIACGDRWPADIPVSVWAGAATACIALLALLQRARCPRLFGLMVQLFLAATGFTLMGRQLADSTCPLPEHEVPAAVRLCDHPIEKARSLMCRVQAEGIREDGQTGHDRLSGKEMLLYFAKDSASFRLKRGDRLMVYARLSPPENNGNPDEFDYAHYLHRQGICATAYVPSGHWTVCGHDSTVSLKQAAMDWRDRLTSMFPALGFEGDNLAVLSALTVGDQDGLSDELVETYSATGASHVLALSGMHIGLFYALFWLLFSPLWKRWTYLKLPLLTVTIASLWAFAFFTGLMPSVVRAVVMFSLLALSEFSADKPFTLNTLAATAFLMLLFRPAWLFDVGFQLSFLAVAGILLIHPRTDSLCPRNCPSVLRKVWSLLSVSTAAQIGVAPLIILYFSRFSTHFLLTNLWAVPMSTLALYAAIAMLALTPFPILQHFAAQVTDRLIGIQNDVLRHIERLPYATIDGLWTDIWAVSLFYLLVVLALRHIRLRTLRSAVLFLTALLLAVCHHSLALWDNAPRTALAFYNVNGCPALHCLSDGPRSWLICPDSTPDTRYLQQALAPHWNRLRLSPPEIMSAHDTCGTSVSISHNIVTYARRRICLLNDNRWQGKSSPTPLHIDYMYVSKGYRGNLHELLALFTIGKVIIDASLSDYYRRHIIDTCAQEGISYVSLKDSGAVRFEL